MLGPLVLYVLHPLLMLLVKLLLLLVENLLEAAELHVEFGRCV